MPPDSYGQFSRPDDKTLADAAQMLRAVLETLPPERPQDAATARRVEGAVIAMETQAKPPSNE